ncbi:MAG: phage holin family protein [Candidatus Rokubacteria bacterium]|jgi:putative membrane protein|nr:phage holin family protein [Candidatus Rokubacteria bacterium]
MLGGFLLRWVFNGIAIYVTSRIVPGLTVPTTTGVIVAALVLGLVNASIRWVFLILTLPLNVLTLGLFTLVINALMLYIVAWLAPGSLQISSFAAAFWGALLIAIISTGLSHLLGR